MNVLTHALIGWTAATVPSSLTRTDRAWVVGAAVASDLDGLGLIAELATRHSTNPLYWWSEYHHVIGHNLLFSVLATGLALLFTRKTVVAVLAFSMVQLHLLGDLVGSRGPDGYQWPVPYLWPFSDLPSLTVPWQWYLNSWPNVALSVALLAHTLWFAWRRGSSPLEFVSIRANRGLVHALRSRFPSPTHRHSGGGSPNPSLQRTPPG